MAKKSIQGTIPADLLRAFDEFARKIPGESMTSIGERIMGDWVSGLEAQAFELYHPTSGPFVKAAGAPFPQRLSDRQRKGRPKTEDALTSSDAFGKIKIYFKEEPVAERIKNAMWWRGEYPGHDIARVLTAFLGSAPTPRKARPISG